MRLTTLLTALVMSACGAARPPLQPALAPLVQVEAAPVPLTANLFRGDESGTVDEASMRTILSAPVFLEEQARIGVVPVSSGYMLDGDLPLSGVTGSLTEALERTGLFEVTSEVTTDWPTDSGVAGLRALATRYRCEYLLLYRHRFEEQEWTNGWAWTWFAVLPGLFVPQSSVQVGGVLEATLFDVKTGTLLFTVYTRTEGEEAFNIWHNDLKRRALKERMLVKASERLVEQAMGKVRRLAAARPVAAPIAAARP